MNYDQPRQLADKTGWHYTRRNDEDVWTLGYCREHLDQPHATEDEARDCYTRYLLEHEVELDGRWHPDAHLRCKAEGCEAFTDRFAQVGRASMGPMYVLCDEHRTREVVTALFGRVGDSIHS